MTTTEAWRDYMRANERANRAYDTHMDELANSAIPLVDRNRAKSARYYRTRIASKENT